MTTEESMKRIAALVVAATEERIWHEGQAKALSKCMQTPDVAFRLAEHRERIDAINGVVWEGAIPTSSGDGIDIDAIVREVCELEGHLSPPSSLDTVITSLGELRGILLRRQPPDLRRLCEELEAARTTLRELLAATDALYWQSASWDGLRNACGKARALLQPETEQKQ